MIVIARGVLLGFVKLLAHTYSRRIKNSQDKYIKMSFFLSNSLSD